MFYSKCGFSVKESDHFCSNCGKGKFSHFCNNFLGLSTRLFGKIQCNFHVAHVLFAGALRVCSLICFYWEGYAAVASPSGNLEVVDC